ncbi:MAG: hypothetical protein K0R65_75 [Crocinitomicaceae bacterium]|jgi:UMF1 family MFS transporter|nr:hypothetical protein [Crocinitomicaceae bacterium]
MEKGNKKIIRGWVMYDWANSVYNLVISSAIFPIFYTKLTEARFKEKYFGLDIETIKAQKLELPENVNVTVDFMGYNVPNTALMSFVLCASFLTISILSPILSGIADYSGSKKRFLQFFCYFGALSCISLFFFNLDHIELSMISVYFASIGFWSSLVFYNSFLPEIAEPEDHDKISARGFSMGYFGSMILLVICLVLIQGFGVDARYCFILVGLWWITFSQFTYRVLPHNVFNKKVEKGIVWRGFRELKLVFAEFRKTHRLKRYLSSFFFFNTGVQTVMLMAVFFAEKEISWPKDSGSSGLIIAILLIQILGAVGAFLMSRLSRRIGNIKTLGLSISIWIVICCVAYIVKTPVQFYCLAAGVGLVMGGVQAMARSTYSKFLPETTDHASYFSFYDVAEKIGIVLGTFFFGFVEAWTGSIRYSVISVAIFFVLGLIMLFRVPKDEVDMGEEHT